MSDDDEENGWDWWLTAEVFLASIAAHLVWDGVGIAWRIFHQ